MLWESGWFCVGGYKTVWKWELFTMNSQSSKLEKPLVAFGRRGVSSCSMDSRFSAFVLLSSIISSSSVLRSVFPDLLLLADGSLWSLHFGWWDSCRDGPLSSTLEPRITEHIKSYIIIRTWHNLGDSRGWLFLNSEKEQICIHNGGSSHLVRSTKAHSVHIINTNSHHIVPLNATVTSPFSPFRGSLRDRHTPWNSNIQLRLPLSPSIKSKECTSWWGKAETKGRINADWSLRRPLDVFCNSFH